MLQLKQKRKLLEGLLWAKKKHVKKLVSVSATSAPITDTSKETTLKQFLCIWYPVWFCQKNNKDKNKDIKALIDLGSGVNIIYSAYTIKLGFRDKKIDIGI